MSREQITKAKRIVIKIGSSSLTGIAGSELDPTAVDHLVDLVVAARGRGAESGCCFLRCNRCGSCTAWT